MGVLNRRWLFRAGAGLFGVLLAIQLVPYGRGHRNPALRSEPPWDSPATRELARQACFDCHSNETQWPAYASIAPASWLVQHDVDEGRAALNFSEWQRPQTVNNAGNDKQRKHRANGARNNSCGFVRS